MEQNEYQITDPTMEGPREPSKNPAADCLLKRRNLM